MGVLCCCRVKSLERTSRRSGPANGGRGLTEVENPLAVWSTGQREDTTASKSYLKSGSLISIMLRVKSGRGGKKFGKKWIKGPTTTHTGLTYSRNSSDESQLEGRYGIGKGVILDRYRLPFLLPGWCA